MSIRTAFLAFGSFLLGFLTQAEAVAQQPFGQPGVPGFGLPGGGSNYGAPGLQPSFSPFLNLTRQGTNPAINLYGIIKPQSQFASSINALQTQTNQLNPFLNPTATSDTPVTGVGFGFQNYRGYYQNQFNAGIYGYGQGRPGVGGFGQTSLQGGSQQYGAFGISPPKR